MVKAKAIEILEECIDIQKAKGEDYQNDKSTVKQADYFPRGLDSIMDMVDIKRTRIRSLMESGATANHEALEDSVMDMINYLSFAAAWINDGIPGQPEYEEELRRVERLKRVMENTQSWDETHPALRKVRPTSDTKS